MKKLFSFLSFLGLLLGQVIPTFGGYIGLVGNWIPFVISSICYILALMVLSVANSSIKLNKSIKVYLFVFLIIFPLQFALHLFWSGGLNNVDQYADFFRAISISLAIVVGYNFAHHSNKKLLVYFFNGLVLFTVILFLDYYFNGQFQGPQKFYATRRMGWRFPGNWNYPYNLSIALYLYFLFSLYKFNTKHKCIVKLWYLLSACFVIVVMFFGQSRSSITALIISFLLIHTCTFRLDISINRIGINLIKSLSLFALSLIILSSLFSIDYSALFPRFEKLNQTASLLDPGNRLTQISTLGSIIKDNPLVLLIGNGPERGQLWIENILLHFYRYGLIGFGLYILMIPVSQIIRILKKRKSLTSSSILVFIMFNWTVYILLNSVGSDVFSVYRFIPLYYFFVGLTEKELDN